MKLSDLLKLKDDGEFLNMYKVQILLSTYNGEKYLREQLNSLLNQKDIETKISVRDDGSTDSTIEILEEYKRAGKLEYYPEENVGYRKSFLKLATYCVGKADYYAFCDQDDVWEPEKLIVAVKKFEGIPEEKYKLYFSNLNVVDENLNKIGVKDYSRMNLTLGSALVRSSIAGCTMVFNDDLLRIALSCNSIENLPDSHDSWLHKVCLSVGGRVIFDSNSYINYRQHGKNVTGIRQGVIKRFTREMQYFTFKRNYKSRIAEIIYRDYFNFIKKENLELLSEISTYKNSFTNTIKLLLNKKLKFGVTIIDVLTKIQIAFRCY